MSERDRKYDVNKLHLILARPVALQAPKKQDTTKIKQQQKYLFFKNGGNKSPKLILDGIAVKLAEENIKILKEIE